MHKVLFDTTLLLNHYEVIDGYTKKKLMEESHPYLLKKDKNNQLLYFIGFDHSNDIKDKQFSIMEKWWNEFVSKVDKAKAICFVEGGLKNTLATFEDSTFKYGEPGFVAYLAEEAGIKWQSPEPDEKEEIEYIIELRSREETMCYYFARLVNQ